MDAFCWPEGVQTQVADGVQVPVGQQVEAGSHACALSDHVQHTRVTHRKKMVATVLMGNTSASCPRALGLQLVNIRSVGRTADTNSVWGGWTRTTVATRR